VVVGGREGNNKCTKANEIYVGVISLSIPLAKVFEAYVDG
jgi:hypothetical protein